MGIDIRGKRRVWKLSGGSEKKRGVLMDRQSTLEPVTNRLSACIVLILLMHRLPLLACLNSTVYFKPGVRSEC
jgi:hypothetical protein